MPEGHNATTIVRDLDGSLVFMWEEPPEYIWRAGELCKGHVRTFPEMVDADPDEELTDEEHELFEAIIDRLPDAPGPTTSY